MMRRHLVCVAVVALFAPGCPGEEDDSGGPPLDLDAFPFPPDATPVDPDRDPCAGVPRAGHCVGAAIELCVAGTGGAEPFVTTVACGAGLACSEGALGATCVLTAACADGWSECRGGALARCEGGTWREEVCPSGCVDTVVGANCKPDVAIETYTNDVTFERVLPDFAVMDWSTEVQTQTASGFLVLSYGDGELIDAAVTDRDGRFAIDAVPAWLEDGDDFLVLIAAHPRGAEAIDYVLAAPGLGGGVNDIATVVEVGAPDPSVWMWSWTSSDIGAEEGVYLSREAGSGAVFAYVFLNAIQSLGTSAFGPRDGTSLVMWLGLGTDWSCGACFLSSPTAIGDMRFSSQVFMPGGADEAYWSGAVLAHELGHWVMSTYGRSPGEGGKHIMGVPSHPGLAWSEGFATWFSSAARAEPFYYDKQRGSFLWVDFATRSYSTGVPWYRPSIDYGLEQLIDENEVARMLLGIGDQGAEVSIFQAIATPRMTDPPFARGYLRRTWDGLDGEGWPLPAWSTDESAPHLADMLDALVCSGAVSASVVDGVTEPWAHYPYPSLAPLCDRAEHPVQVTWRDDATAAREASAEVRWYVPLDEPLTIVLTPDGPTHVVPAGTGPGSVVVGALPRTSATSPTSGPGAARSPAREVHVATGGERWRLVARVPQEAPRAQAAPRRDGPRVVLQGRDLGRAIRLRAR